MNLAGFQNELVKITDIALEHDAIVMSPENALVAVRAARFGHVQLLKFLLPKIRQHNVTDVIKEAYKTAVAHGQTAAVHFLIKNTDANLEECCGWAPLRSAAMEGNFRMCNMILTEQAIRYKQDPVRFVFNAGEVTYQEMRSQLTLHVSGIILTIDKLAYRALSQYI